LQVLRPRDEPITALQKPLMTTEKIECAESAGLTN
jgi:hypothetical protein